MNKKYRNTFSILIIVMFVAFGLLFLGDKKTELPNTDMNTNDVQQENKDTAHNQLEVEVIEDDINEKFFKTLDDTQLINDHVYSYIDIENTKVSFPILQHPSDDSYYLRRDIERNDHSAGVIYSESINNSDYSDKLTILYGHDNDREEMFANLRSYYDSEYINDNKIIDIYLDDKKLEYEIFASVVYDDRYIPYKYDFSNTQSVQAFVNSLNDFDDRKDSNILEQIELQDDDKLLVLSTCYKFDSSKRFLVVSKLKNTIIKNS